MMQKGRAITACVIALLLARAAVTWASGEAAEPSRKELLEACAAGNYGERLADLLLRHPDAIENANQEGQPLVAAAVRARSAACIAYLLAKGADPDIRDATGETALEMAMRWGDRRSIALLAEHVGLYDLPSFATLARIDLALDAFARRRSVWNPKDQAIERFRLLVPPTKSVQWTSLVIAMNEADGDGPTRLLSCLKIMCRMHDRQVESELLGRAAPVLAHRLSLEQRRSLAITAIMAENETMLEVARKSGLESDANLDRQVKSLLEEAVTKGSELRVAMIVRARLVDQRELDKIALWCAESGRSALFFDLLGAGVDKDTKDERGETLLMKAAARGYSDMVEYLLARGADASPRDASGADAATHAQRATRDPILIDALRSAATQPSRKEMKRGGTE